MSSRPGVGLALIGAGPWGRNYIRAIEASSEARLAAVASRNPETRRLIGDTCAVYSEWQEAVENPEVEGVVIATPPHTHAEIACVALAAGRGVLIEKPLAMLESEARAVAAAASASNRPAMVNHIHLHHPAFRALKDELSRLGEVRAIHGEAGRAGPFRQGVSVLWDWGPHDVAMALAVTGGDPIATSAQRQRRRHLGGSGEHVKLQLAFEGGVQVEISVSNVLDHPVRQFRVECEGGWALYDSVGPQPLIIQKGNDRPQPVAVSDRKPLDCALSAFCTALISNQSTPDDIALGVRVVSILAACETAMVDVPVCAADPK